MAVVRLPLCFLKGTLTSSPFKLDTHLRKPRVSTFSVSTVVPQQVMVPKKDMRHGIPGLGGDSPRQKDYACGIPLKFSHSSAHPSTHPFVHLFPFDACLSHRPHSTCWGHSATAPEQPVKTAPHSGEERGSYAKPLTCRPDAVILGASLNPPPPPRISVSLFKWG